MIDHVLIRVSDVETSKRFYEQIFVPLGYAVAFGEAGNFWSFNIGEGLFEIQQAELDALPITPVHIAFRVKDRGVVEAFHKAGLAAGGRDNGIPGLRPVYAAHYYASFILDPDGHNIEAMIDPIG